ncbi:MAG: hypothetical protein HYZ50_12490 [Deltaproteobacteria bacterium]|nr:hypothetical protein [Deltaproteobacteria bacterium]
MTAHDLLKNCEEQGVHIEAGPSGKLRLRPPGKIPDDMKQKLRQHKDEILLILCQQRRFLSRPLGQENNPAPWLAWEPLLGWLLEHHPEHYSAVCEAEGAITALEREGMTQGLAYRLACDDLRQRFETARKLALKERVRVWMQ